LKDKGIALVIVLMVVAVFSVLGVTLLNMTLLDKKIGRHVALYDQLYYYAESGVEAVVAELPREWQPFLSFSGVIERLEEPSFRVEMLPFENGKLIRSVGMAKGKSRMIEVVARMSLFGGQVLFSCGDIRLDSVEVTGNVRGNDVVFRYGESTVRGRILHAGEVKTEGGGRYRLLGRSCAIDDTGDVMFDFDLLEEMVDEGWCVAEGEKQYEWGELDRDGCGKVFVPGDLTISDFLKFDGIIVVRGNVDLSCAGTESRVVILAEGDIKFRGGGGLVQQYNGNTVLYSGGDILDRRVGIKPQLMMNGIIMARGDIELGNFALACNEELLFEHEEIFAQVDFTQFSCFLLEWLSVSPRR